MILKKLLTQSIIALRTMAIAFTTTVFGLITVQQAYGMDRFVDQDEEKPMKQKKRFHSPERVRIQAEQPESPTKKIKINDIFDNSTIRENTAPVVPPFESKHSFKESSSSQEAEEVKPIDIQDEKSDTALIRACKDDKLETVKQLLKDGARVDIKNNNGDTAFMSASFSDEPNIEIVKIFIEHKTNNLNDQDEYGWTALHCCCSRGDAQMVTALLQAGANPNIQNEDGETPLPILLRGDLDGDQEAQLKIVKSFLKFRFNPFIIDNNKETILHEACRYKGAPVIKEVINYIKTNEIFLNYNIFSDWNSLKKLHFLFKFNEKFYEKTVLFVMILKRHQQQTGLKIPKYVLFDILLWGTNPVLDFVHAKNKDNKTGLMIAGERKDNDCIKLLEEYESK